MSLQSPLAKVRGLGSAKHGTQFWWYQRLTAVLLVPLSIWLLFSLISITSMEHSSVVLWIKTPVNAVFLILFVVALFYHAQLGMQVVVEDYIESEWQKLVNIILIKFLALFACLTSVLAILKIFLGL